MGIFNVSHKKFGKKFKKACFTVFFSVISVVTQNESTIHYRPQGNCIHYHYESFQGQLVLLKESPYIH